MDDRARAYRLCLNFSRIPVIHLLSDYHHVTMCIVFPAWRRVYKLGPAWLNVSTFSMFQLSLLNHFEFAFFFSFGHFFSAFQSFDCVKYWQQLRVQTTRWSRFFSLLATRIVGQADDEKTISIHDKYFRSSFCEAKLIFLSIPQFCSCLLQNLCRVRCIWKQFTLSIERKFALSRIAILVLFFSIE